MTEPTPPHEDADPVHAHDADATPDAVADHAVADHDVADHAPADAGAEATPEPVVDFSRTARRLRVVLSTILSTAVVLWLVIGFAGDGLEPRLLAELLGLGLLLAFAVEVVVVGGAALRGMLRAGARGDRLASADVTLLPPQLTRRRRR